MHAMQIAAAEAVARAEAQELEGWKRDSTAVLAALDSTLAEKITEVSHTNLFCQLQLLLSDTFAKSLVSIAKPCPTKHGCFVKGLSK